ncbi:MAG: NADH-quinone oxidoreductase subunit NuoG, partial [Acidimicrobiia bacterium]
MSDRDQPMSQWPSTHRFVIPVADGPDEVTVTIDGSEVTAPRGELLIRVAQDHGTYIPRFCYHERMKPVGMCRMCLVEVEGMRGFQISCATPVTDGMVVRTASDDVKTVQDGVLEFLLINHPLDCPVCDRGGECPLQDQTLAFGPGESRFVEEKRHFTKPIPISELVLLDRERCIQCGRCTRFASEIAGDPLIDFGGRGDETEVITFPGEPFTSYFSGNIVQICPVGALTAKPYRFKARPWDLSSAETSCTTCSVGCRGALDSSSNRLLRLLGVDSEPINHGWLCDKGRFSYEHVHSWRRVRNPMIRKEGEMVECSWPEALDAAAEGLRNAIGSGGSGSVAVLGGARGTNEDAYLWSKLAKNVLGTDNVDAQLGDGLPAATVLGLPGATIADCDRAAGIVLLASDLKEELPVLSLRVKRAADDLGIPLVDISARDHGLSRYCSATIRITPGEQATAAHKLANAIGGAVTGDQQVDAAAELLRAGGPNPSGHNADGPIVVIVGRPSVAESADGTVAAAAELLAVGDRVRFLSALRRGNVRGALELGLTPGYLPGRVALDAGREWFAEHWGDLPATPGLDATGILAAAQDGRVGALVLLGADVLDDFPDRSLARAALDAAPFVVGVGAFLTESAERADVFLPTTGWGEQTGTTT